MNENDKKAAEALYHRLVALTEAEDRGDNGNALETIQRVLTMLVAGGTLDVIFDSVSDGRACAEAVNRHAPTVEDKLRLGRDFSILSEALQMVKSQVWRQAFHQADVPFGSEAQKHLKKLMNERRAMEAAQELLGIGAAEDGENGPVPDFRNVDPSTLS